MKKKTGTIAKKEAGPAVLVFTAMALLLFQILLSSAVRPPGAVTGTPGRDTTRQYYLFCYFLDQHQGMCYALSTDGILWQPLNGNKPFLVPEIDSQKLMRDPSINQGADGIYRVVWTTGWHGTGIGYAWSRDLVHWSPEQLLAVMKDVPGTGHCWAPEIFYDRAKKRYLVFWSSDVDGIWSIYYTTTRDFKRFGKPGVLFSNGGTGGGKTGDQGPIDAFIFRDTARYILFYKKDDNTRVPNLYYRFGPGPTGPWGPETGPMTPSTGDEGPSCVKTGGQYRVYTDPFQSHMAFLYTSTDLVTWTSRSTNLRMSHGTVLPISSGMAHALLERDKTR